ncbi:MAG: LuxR C-terminal-related transcriptional regulator [Treponema sp.]|nr:LuxR C-terminal-related transcriptional regulator [Treponema sp.]
MMTGNSSFHSNVPIAPGNRVYLERPQIYRLLEGAVRSPIVTVIAGAGYGKTYSVYSFVHKYNANVIWIQFSERDNIAERFWENFVATLSVMNKEKGVKLAKIRFPETEQQFERYLVISRAYMIPGEKYIFVYDDFHLIHEKPVLRFLERSITSPFPNIASILIARSAPKLNLMSQFAKGLVAQISEEDLRFSREEMLEYFRLQQVQPAANTASRIYQDTEGWAFSIHLAVLALKNDSSGRGYALSAVRMNVFKLIESEVIAVISGRLRKYLIALSLIEHFALDLLEELAGDMDGGRLLKELEQVGSFVRYDSYLNAYHLHHFFLAYLSGKQGELSEEEKRKVYCRAAAWCERNNLKMDAISYYAKAGTYDSIIEVVYRGLPLVLPNRIAQFLLEIFERAPEEVYRKVPAAWVFYVRLLITLEMFDRAETEVKRFIAILEAEERTPFHCIVLSGSYNNLGFIGMFTSMYSRDYSYVPYFERGLYYYRLNNYLVLGPLAVFGVSSFICRVSVPDKGEIEKYIEALAGMVPYISGSMNGCAWGLDDLARGELAFFRADIAQAERFNNEAVRKARERNQYEIENRALFYLMRIGLFQGNREKTEDCLKRLEDQLNQPDYINRYIYHDIVMGWFYVHTGRPEKIAPWIQNDLEESGLNSMDCGLEFLVRAKYHIAEKKYQAAMSVVGYQKGSHHYGNCLLGRIEINLIEAVCRYRLRDIPAAVRALERAYELAAPNGLDMPFIEPGRDMRAVTGAALKVPDCAIPRAWLERIQRAATACARRMFTIAEYHQGRNQRRSRKWEAGESLSPREIKILTGLSQGLTREEIASAFSLSINTVKSVIRSVYNKLGAVNRADAVRIATARNMLK